MCVMCVSTVASSIRAPSRCRRLRHHLDQSRAYLGAPTAICTLAALFVSSSHSRSSSVLGVVWARVIVG